MKQITVTDEKKLTVAQRIIKAPYEVLADGVVIGTFRTKDIKPADDKPSEFQDTGKTKCPNCKFEYDLEKKDNTPSFFSIQHP
jgi:hypothetical protein